MSQMLKSVVSLRGCVTTAVALALLAGITPQRTASAQTTVGQAGAPKEGVQVHGHWKIEIHQPNGDLVSRTEFDNALTYGGGLLASVLGRTVSFGRWLVVLSTNNNNATNAPCFDEQDGEIFSRPCSVVEPNEPGGSLPYFFNNLAIQAPSPVTNPSVWQNGPDLGVAIVLSGTATARRAGAIEKVETHLSFCGGDISPLNCSTSASRTFPFSRAVFGAISVVQGQLIQVQVTFTFGPNFS